VKKTGTKPAATKTRVFYRDFWGPAAVKRAGLLASLPTGVSSAGGAAAPYEKIVPAQENRWRLAPRMIEGGFESWPGLDELFPVKVQGVNHNRGIDGSVIDTDLPRLLSRMKTYIAAKDFGAAAKTCAELAPLAKADGTFAIAG
jgi:hypothetical protein